VAAKSFFEARKILNEALDRDEIELPSNDLYVFWLLLAHMIYSGHSARWVTANCCGLKNLSARTGLSQSAIRRALEGLEENQFIRTHVRPKPGGGRYPDEIEVTWWEIMVDPEYLSRPWEDSPQNASDSPQDASEGSEAFPQDASSSTKSRFKND